MTFSFYLKDKNRADGTPLVLIINQHGKQYKKAIGVTVRPADFKKQRVKDESVNAKLRRIEIRLNERLNQFSTEKDILDAIEYALNGEEQLVKKRPEGVLRPRFWDFFKAWAQADVPSRKDRWLAYRRLSEIMGTAEDWEAIDTAYHSRLVARLNDLGYSENYKATLIAKLKTVMIEGEKMKFHKNREYKKFSYKWETADTIALSQEEVDAIWNAKLTGTKARVRDAFIVGCFTAARHSDYSKISTDNIQNGKLTIQFKQRKTQGEVVIPVSPKVLEVLRRNGGRVPHISPAEIGRYMKEICRDLGGTFNDKVEISKSKGAYHFIEKKARWELVSAHTSRRTAASILYLHYKVPAYLCCKLTGHKDLRTFLSYVKATKEESVRLLQEVEFFK